MAYYWARDTSSMKKVSLIAILLVCIAVIESAYVNISLSSRNVRVGQGLNVSVLSLSPTVNSLDFDRLECGYEVNTTLRVIGTYNKRSKYFVEPKNGLPAEFSGRIRFSTAERIIIHPVQFRDEKLLFYCVLEYYSASRLVYTRSQKLQLRNVYEYPVFESGYMPATSNVVEGTHSYIQCNVISRPASTISWSWEGILSAIINQRIHKAGYYYRTIGSYRVIFPDANVNGLRLTCTATPMFGLPINRTTTLNFQYRPKNTTFSVIPNVIFLNDTIQLKCHAVGKPRVSQYIFYIGSKIIAAATAGLVTTTVRNCKDFTGDYRCQPVSKIGYGEEKSTYRIIRDNVKITQQLSSREINETQRFMLPCVARGCPSPKITWTKDGRTQLRFGQNLLIYNASKYDAGKYTCIAHNSFTNDSSQMTLIVNYRPINTILRASTMSPVENSTVVFNCSAAAVPSPTYHFYMLNEMNKTNIKIKTSSGKTGILTITVTRTSINQYRFGIVCIPYNMLGNGSSSSLTLQLKVPPQIILEISPSTINETQNVTVFCRVLSANPAPLLEIRNPANKKLPKSANKVHLVNVTRGQGGRYSCMAVNGVGVLPVVANSTLIVNHRPDRVEMMSTTLMPLNGTSVKLSCTTRSTPKPRFRFYKQNKTGVFLLQDSTLSNYTTGVFNYIEYSGYTATFTCVPYNFLGDGNWQAVNLNIRVRPLLNEIKDSIVTEGDMVELNCSIIASNPWPVFRWRDAAGAFTALSSSGILTIKSIRRNQAGVYNCEARNGVGNVTRKTVSVTVNFPPTITLNVTGNVTVNERDNVTVYCLTDAKPNASVTWKNASGHDLHHRNGLLVLHFVAMQDVGIYTCQASNGIGPAARKSFSLVVLRFARFQVPSVDTIRHVNRTEAVEMTWIYAVGNQAQLQYLRCGYINGREIVMKNRTDVASITTDFRRKFDIIDDVIGRFAIRLKRADYGDIGQFQCNISYAGRIVTSKSYSIAVVERPTFIECLGNTSTEFEIVEGGSFSSTCIVYGSPPPTLRCAILNNLGTTVQSTTMAVTNYTLTKPLVFNSLTRDADRIVCYAFHYITGIERVSRRIIVNYPPDRTSFRTLTTKPLNGTSVTLNCTSNGMPRPYYKFYQKDNIKWNLVQQGSSSQFFINSIDYRSYIDFKVTFMCIPVNILGNGSVKSTTLEIQVKPQIVISPSVAVVEGESIKLSCNVTVANPSAVLQWVDNTQRLIWYKYGTNSAFLNLKNLRRSQAGKYTCKATNSIGISRMHTQLTIKYAAGKPTNLELSRATFTSLTVIWMSPLDKGVPKARNYNITAYHNDTYQSEAQVSVGEEATKISRKIENLLPRVSYNVSVYFFNDVGKGPSTWQVFKTIPYPDIDECADGTHKCHRDATCTNTPGSYTCKCNGNKIGNGIICGEPAAFKDSPLSVRVRSGEKVTLSCSYYNSTKTVQFQWIKDYSSIAIGGYKLGTVRKNDRGGVDITTQTMEFNITDVSKQGYYWCKIKEGSVVDTISGKAVVRLTDASSTRLSMKIEKTYSVALNQTTSAEHKDLQQKIRTQVMNYMGTMLPKTARTRRSTHAGDPVVLLKNIQRDGTSNILLDAIVYYEKVTATKRLQICSAMQNTTANTLSSSSLKVIDVTRETYDCCYTSWSGDPDIKGVIMWPTQVISETSVVTCPTTRSNENATRTCVSNDFDQEPSWQLPNTDKCLFTREATQKLDTLTKTVVNASNAVKVVKELEQVTNNQTNIKTYVDVALAVDVVANVAETQSNNTEAFDGIVNVTNSLMAADTSVVGAAQQKNNASEKLIKAIEKFADNIPLSRNETTKVFSKKNLAIGIADVSKDEKSLEENGFFISGSIGEKETNIDMKKFDGKTEAAKVADIVLPGPLFKKAKNQPGAIKTGLRVTTFLYDNQKLFLSKETSGKNASKKINSKILAVAIKGVKLENLTETQRVRSEFREQLNETEDKSLMCVFWDVSTREWSTRGCRYDGPNPKTPRNHKCSCNHMTNFALLLDVTQKPEGAKSSASAKEFLQFFTLIGCGISLAGLFITLGTIVFFKNLRKKDPQRILLGICCSLILTLIAFLIGTQFTLRFTENQKMLVPNSPTACLVSSVLTHFFVLCAFFWMAMQAYYLYLSCVKVVGVHTTHIMKKMTFTALGVPLVIVAVVIGTDYKNIIEYTKQVKLSVNDTDKILNRGNSYVNIVDESNQICMINGIQFYAAYLGPIGFILLINAVFLTLSLHGIFTSAKKTKSKGMKWQRKWRMVTACTVLLGLTWLIGVFAIGPLKLTLQILFTVFNSLQGLFIFIFYCLLNPKVRQEWRKCLFGDTTEFSSSTRSTKKSTSSFLSSSKSRSSKKATSKKSKKADENENKNEDEERSRTFTDSLSALQREFAKEDYQEKSVFLKLRDRKGFYSIVNEDTRETQTATFTVKRNPNLSTSL